MSNKMFKSKFFHTPNVSGVTARIPSTPGTGKVLKGHAFVMRSPYPKVSDEFQTVSKISNEPPKTSLDKSPQPDQPTILHTSESESSVKKPDLVGRGELHLSDEKQESEKNKIHKLMEKSAIEARTLKIDQSRKRPVKSESRASPKYNFTFKKKKI